MAKKIEVESAPTELKIGKGIETPELTHSAFTIVKNDGLYSVLKVGVAPNEKISGNVEIVQAGLSKEAAENLFKVRVAHEVFLKQG